MRKLVPFSVVLLLGLALGGSAGAAEPTSSVTAPGDVAPEVDATPTSTAKRPTPVGFVVSGGVSLGAYEAGFLHYLVETMKRNPGLYDVRIATGASAGSINGLLTLLASCDDPNDDPKKSLFYGTWTPIGLPGLHDPSRPSAIALFSRRPLDTVADRILARVARGFPTSCDVVLGVTTTRLTNTREAHGAHGRLELPRAEERFVVRMRGEGAGKPLSLESYVDTTYGFPQPLLPFDENSSHNALLLRDLLYASSAFPFAFTPVSLPYCMTRTRGPTPPCEASNATHARFVDGGVFDNQPLGLAARLAGDGLTPGGARATFVSPLVRRNALPSDDTILVYVDPELTSFSRAKDTDESTRMRSASALGLHYAESFVESARTKELSSVLEATPELRDRLAIAASDVPPVSHSLASFFGFFDTRFREHDFYLGMRAARRFMDGRLASRLAKARGGRPRIAYYEDTVTTNLEPYHCMRAVLDEVGDPALVCKGVSLELRAALATSIARLYDGCASAREAGSRDFGESRACERAMRGGEPQRVPDTPRAPLGFHRKRTGESELAYTVRLLVGYGFVFKDLGLGKVDAARVEREIHERLRETLDTFASAQPENGAAIGALGHTLLGTLTYVPASAIVHVAVGPVVEAGASFRLGAGASRFLRATLAADLGGLSSFTGSGAYLTAAPMAGLEAEVLPISGPVIQPRLGLRGGYLFSTEDGFATSACPDPRALVCSRPTAQAYVAASVFDRVRLQVGLAAIFPVRTHEETSWSLLPTGGLQFLWP